MKTSTLRLSLATAFTALVATGFFLSTPKHAEAAWIRVKKAVQAVSSVKIAWKQSDGSTGTMYVIPGAHRLESPLYIRVQNSEGCFAAGRNGAVDVECSGPVPDPADQTFPALTPGFAQTPEYLGRDTYAGRALDKFGFKAQKLNGGQVEASVGNGAWTYWIDPETNLPVHSEYSDGRTHTDCDYEFDVNLSPDLFQIPLLHKTK
jgi:hypothetical protein